MDAIAGLSFREPLWLWLLAAIPLAGWFLVVRERERRELAARFVSEQLRGRDRLRPLRPVAMSFGLLFTILALAGPRLGSVEVELPRSDASRILAIDVSASMGAEDVGTSRMIAAKSLARRIVRDHPGRAGLVIFEGKAVVVSPLTTDTEAVATLLESIEPGELSEPGSDLGAAVAESLRLASSTGPSSTDIVLISDGENRSGGWERSVESAKAAGIRVSSILVGTPAGERIPIGGGEVLKDEDGEVVVTHASSEVLEKIANATDGVFLENPFGERSLEALQVRTPGVSKERETSRIPIERFQWPLGAAVSLFLIGSILHRGAE